MLSGRMTEKISIVVLNYNGAHLLPDCLESLLVQDYPNFEILVVDNASIDKSQEITKQYKDVRWVELKINEGIGPGYNAGVRAAGGKKIFVANNDMRFEPNCVSELARAFADNIFSTDPLQKDWDGRKIIHGAQKFIFRLNWTFGVPFLYPFQDDTSRQKVNVSWACAGAMMMDRAKFEKLGGFDPTFFTYYEDLDICWRAWMHGWRTVFVPTACLYHKVGETDDTKLRQNNPELMRKNPPSVNLRRQMSQCKNAERFILKTMPLPLVLAAYAVGFARFCGNLLTGRFVSGWLRLRAFLNNLMQWTEILRERKALHKSAVTSSWELLFRLASKPEDR